MRKKTMPPELPVPAEEIISPAGEYAPSADGEFPTVAPEFGSGRNTEAVPSRRRRLKHLFAVPALILVVSMALGARGASPAPLPEPEPEPAPPTVIETYPLEEGELLITVYNDTVSFQYPGKGEFSDNFVTVIDQVRVSEADFTGYALPEPIRPEGFEFRGWILHYGDPFDFGSTEDVYSSGSDPAPGVITSGRQILVPLEGALITREDAERVPRSEDGTRYLNVHAMWLLDPSADTKMQIVFHDEGDEWTLGADSPAYSEGITYLAAYPVPERDGYEFTGWYDENGEKVEVLDYFMFYGWQMSEDGIPVYDWDDLRQVHLYAKWEKTD